jgi:hypothetical protein
VTINSLEDSPSPGEPDDTVGKAAAALSPLLPEPESPPSNDPPETFAAPRPGVPSIVIDSGDPEDREWSPVPFEVELSNSASSRETSIINADVPQPPTTHEWVPQPRYMPFDANTSPSVEVTTPPMRTWAAPESLAWADLAGVPWHGSDDWDPAARLAENPFAPYPAASPGAQITEAATVASGHRARLLVRELVETALLALLVFLCVRATFQNFKVDGHSMDPTLDNGEFLIVNKLVYAEVNMEKLARFIPLMDPGNEQMRHVFHPPQRGNIIVLKHPSHPETDLIKRVVGLPG